jgi:hypothetical protein
VTGVQTCALPIYLAITNSNQQTVISFRIPPDTNHIDYVKHGLVL